MVEQDLTLTDTDFSKIDKGVRPSVASVFLLSISSGIPFLLLLSTLSIWLIENDISKTTIGLFAWATIPYTCKGLVAPFIDRYDIPFFTCVLGKRRGWMLFSQVALAISILFLGTSNPAENIYYTSMAAFLVGCFSALQDILVETYRAEIVDREHIGITSTASVLGYRVGMLLSGAGAIYIAAIFSSWAVSYSVMAAFICIGMVTTIFSKEPKRHINTSSINNSDGVISYLKTLYILPLYQFSKDHNLGVIFLYILTFKVTDTVLNVMTMPFLVEVGFSKLEIAHVAKTFGILSMIAGGIYGGYILHKRTFYQVLLTTAVLQLAACLLFYIQALLGYNLAWLVSTMGIENFVCGLGQVVLIAYLSKLAHCSYTATRYAVLSSIASLIRVVFSSAAGVIADSLSWPDFYSLVFIASIPCIAVLALFKEHFVQLK